MWGLHEMVFMGPQSAWVTARQLKRLKAAGLVEPINQVVHRPTEGTTPDDVWACLAPVS